MYQQKCVLSVDFCDAVLPNGIVACRETEEGERDSGDCEGGPGEESQTRLHTR